MDNIIKDLEEAAERYAKESKKRTKPATFEELRAISMSPYESMTYREMKPSLKIHFKSIRIGNLIYEGVRK